MIYGRLVAAFCVGAIVAGLVVGGHDGEIEIRDWRTGDVLVWDNASVQHKAGGNFAVGEPRRFWRYMIAGEAPA